MDDWTREEHVRISHFTSLPALERALRKTSAALSLHVDILSTKNLRAVLETLRCGVFTNLRALFIGNLLFDKHVEQLTEALQRHMPYLQQLRVAFFVKEVMPASTLLRCLKGFPITALSISRWGGFSDELALDFCELLHTKQDSLQALEVNSDFSFPLNKVIQLPNLEVFRVERATLLALQTELLCKMLEMMPRLRHVTVVPDKMSLKVLCAFFRSSYRSIRELNLISSFQLPLELLESLKKKHTTSSAALLSI